MPHLDQSSLPTVLALAHELKQMTFYLETGLLAESLFQFTKSTIGKVNHGPTASANQMMVVS